jgi:hypothetical protein
MRSEDEKKTIIKSLKMTKNECSTIEEKAKENGESFSRYMVDSAVNGGQNTLSPQIPVMVTNIVNAAEEIAKQRNRRGITALRKDVEKLWSML